MGRGGKNVNSIRFAFRTTFSKPVSQYLYSKVDEFRNLSSTSLLFSTNIKYFPYSTNCGLLSLLNAVPVVRTLCFVQHFTAFGFELSTNDRPIICLMHRQRVQYSLVLVVVCCCCCLAVGIISIWRISDFEHSNVDRVLLRTGTRMCLSYRIYKLAKKKYDGTCRIISFRNLG